MASLDHSRQRIVYLIAYSRADTTKFPSGGDGLLQVRNYLDKKFGVQTNFSDNHNLYYTAYQYVTKENCEALHSSGHPDLTDVVPWTEAAKTSRKRKAKDKDKGQGKK